MGVPSDIVKVEGDLKREWKRKDKEARSGGASAVGADAKAGAKADSKAGGNKRKRDGEEESVPTPKATTAKKNKAADSTPAKKTDTDAGTGT